MIQGFRRPYLPLNPHQVAEVVRRRDAGETWMSIGRDFGKQDGVLKRAYDLAKSPRPASLLIAA